jgi:hypothetical protein
MHRGDSTCTTETAAAAAASATPPATTVARVKLKLLSQCCGRHLLGVLWLLRGLHAAYPMECLALCSCRGGVTGREVSMCTAVKHVDWYCIRCDLAGC